MSDQLKRLLDETLLPNSIKADLWDMFSGSTDTKTLESKLDSYEVPLPAAVKADLWDLKANPEAVPERAQLPRPTPVDLADYGVQLLANIPGSARDLVVDTVKGIPDALKVVGKIGLETLVDPHHPSLTGVKAVTGIAQHYAGRYGGLTKASETFRDDPVGAVADIVPLGKPIQVAGTVAKGTRGLKTVGNVVERVGGGLDSPATAATVPLKFATKVASTGLSKVGEGLYRGMLTEGEVQRAIAAARKKGEKQLVDGSLVPVPFPEEFGIREGIIPTKRRVGTRIGEAEDVLEEIVQKARAREAAAGPFQTMREKLAAMHEEIVASRPHRERLVNLENLDKSITTGRPRITPMDALLMGVGGSIGGFTGSIPAGLMGATVGAALRQPRVRGRIAIEVGRVGKGVVKAAPAVGPTIRAALIARLVAAGMDPELAEVAVDREMSSTK